MVQSRSIRIKTKGDGDILDITSYVAKEVKSADIINGIVTVFIPGSTASITSIEYESGVVKDLKMAIERMAPKNIHYEHDARWGDGNGYAHVRAALVGASFTVPFEDKNLLLGTWQQIVLIDFDNRPRTREIYLQIIGN